MEPANLQSLLDQSEKETSTPTEAVATFVQKYTNWQEQLQVETARELAETREMAKKLGEGVKKYKNALDNLKKVLSSTDE